MIIMQTGGVAFAAEKWSAYYRFDEGEGHVRCKVSKANEGTLYGARYVKMHKGSAIAIDGNSFVKLAGTKLQNFGAGDFTVDLWMKLDALQSGGIYGKKGKTPNSKGWRFTWDQETKQLEFNIADGQAHGKIAARLADRKWHHVAAVRQGKTIKLYIEGKVAAVDIQKIFAADVSNDAVFPRMGYSPDKNSIKGKLDEVRLYSHAIKPGGIAAHYRSQKKNMALSEVKDPFAITDPLVLHYTFDADDGEAVKDKSKYKHDAKITKAKHLAQVNGRRGIMRFDGKESILTCPKSEALNIQGDMSFEMWVRENGTIDHLWGVFFGDTQEFDFYFAGYHSLVLWYVNRNGQYKNESMLLPVDRYIHGEKWSHIAVVVEYPRTRFYHNGKLIRDAYMPVPGISHNMSYPYVIGKNIPIDLDEFRLYNRALTAQEVAAHYEGKQAPANITAELVIEPHWYDDTVTVRISTKNAEYFGHKAELKLIPGSNTKTVKMTESFNGSGRYVASAAFALTPLAGKAVTANVRVLDRNGKEVNTATRNIALTKPDWVDSREGYSDKVLAPWTPVAAKKTGNKVQVDVWQRTYTFSESPFPSQIKANGKQLLTAPITLTGRADGKSINWEHGRVRLVDSKDIAATVQQTSTSSALSMTVNTTTEFDGFMTIDCKIKVSRDVSIDELSLSIPLNTQYVPLCYGERALPIDRDIPIAEFYSGELHDDQSFRFCPTVWLGDVQQGLCWQAESDEDWHYADKQKAIEILPREKMTTFKAHFVDVKTTLKAGDTLHYKFALQGTPIKPLLRDAWDLRVMRSEPYGLELGLPDNTVGGKPTIQYLKETGMRHLFTTGNDLWPYPLPIHEQYKKLQHRLNDQMHAAGMKIHNYQMHQRFATSAPEFDIHGLHMAMRPMRQYIPGNNPPNDPRPGPVVVKYGASSQGTVMHCPKSMALQDANIHAYAKRLDIYGDDGIYLDGTNANPPCSNLGHGCGYINKDGQIQNTFPVFAARQIMKRIYVVTKTQKPDGIVDVHCSFGYNPPALGFADIIWTGEQWYHLRHTGAKHAATHMTLEKFRTEFMGSTIGVAANTLSYRLGSPMIVSATSLLHDIPVRPSSIYDTKRKVDTSYTATMIKLWKVRDKFGAEDAQKLFYWNNQQYITVSPDHCAAFLLHHPTNGVLAFITNRSTDKQDVNVQFNLDKLGLKDRKIKVFNAITDEPMTMTGDGQMTIPLESEHWLYVWLQPAS